MLGGIVAGTTRAGTGSGTAAPRGTAASRGTVAPRAARRRRRNGRGTLPVRFGLASARRRAAPAWPAAHGSGWPTLGS